ncbi:MAG: NAD(P)H-dependent oxidoreductase subunit E, partial [Planctomycetota bacterium]
MNVPAIPPLPGAGTPAAGAAAGAAARLIAAAAAGVPVDPAPFPPEPIRATCERIVARYPTRVAALLPVLHVAQRHYDGWVGPEVEAGVACWLDCSPAHVRGVLTFYSMFHTQPRGRHEVWVCRTLTCWLKGARKLAEVACEKAGLEGRDATTPKTGEDGKFTVMEMECLGLCEVAP